MESIQQSMKHITQKSSFQKHFQQLKTRILSDEEIQAFIKEETLPESAVDQSLSRLYEYMEQRDHCRSCPGLENCPNLMPGYEPHLFRNRDYIDIRYERCALKRQDDEKKHQQKLISSLYIPKEVLRARFQNLDVDQHRLAAVDEAARYVETFQPGETKHGLYFYGSFGVGKTYLMCAIANELAETKNVASLIIYVPDFFNEMKQSIGRDDLQEKLNYIKSVPVLMLDDIGAESMSSWVRDDILGSILQYRMMEELPTLYTSNYDYDGLEEHLAYSQKNGVEEVKAKRIMERIRSFTTPFFLSGENRRRHGSDQ